MATSIFDIAGVSPTVAQAERDFARENVSRNVAEAVRQKMIADEDAAMAMPLSAPAPAYTMPASIAPSVTAQANTLASSAKQAYDRQREEQRARQAFTPPSYGLSPLESQARFGSQAYAGQEKNIGAMQEIFGRMQAGGAVPPIGLTGLLASGFADYTNSKIFENLQKGGRAIYGDGRLQGVVLDGRYTGASAFDPIAARFPTYDDEPQPEVVLPEYDPVAKAKRCPEGYTFDEDLQACRINAAIPNMPASTDRSSFYQQPYQSTGLLDQDGFEYGVPLIYG